MFYYFLLEVEDLNSESLSKEMVAISMSKAPK